MNLKILINALLATNLPDVPSILSEIDPSDAIPTTSTGELGATFAKMLLTFAALILLLFGTYWFLRRLIQSRLQKGVGVPSIQVLEKKMISTKTMLYLIEVENKKVLLAESHLEIKRIESFPLEEVETNPNLPS